MDFGLSRQQETPADEIKKFFRNEVDPIAEVYVVIF